MCHCRFHQSYRRFTTRHHQLIPFFGFGRRKSSSSSNPKHWLSGKGGNGLQSKSNNSHLQRNSSCHSNTSNGTGLHNYQMHTNEQQRGQFNRHLAMNLENDMYYTVDFSESQHSPLIQ